jgi:hypothetical protein
MGCKLIFPRLLNITRSDLCPSPLPLSPAGRGEGEGNLCSMPHALCAFYSFIAPIVPPRTKYRRFRIAKITIGSVVSVAAANIRPHSIWV